MVARRNVRNPAVGDSIRRLIHKTESQATHPHGIKEAGPDEGTLYSLSDGSQLLFDGQKAVELETTVNDAAQRAQEAADTVATVGTDLDAAEARLDTMDQDIVEIRGGDIDVPGTLAAKVVQAMDIESKRLVVTEDAVLNRATVIEGIVTSELVAERIVISDLGYDLMQEAALTVTSPAGTVELSGSGYKAWDANNQLTVDLNGYDNLLTGQFQTATSGTRVTLSTRLAQGSTNPEFGTSALDFFVGSEGAHGALWYDSGANRFLNLYAIPTATGFDANSATGITIHNDSDGIQLNGRLANSRAIQKWYFEWPDPGFAPGAFQTNVSVTFPTPFKTVPHVLCQAQSTNSTDMMITVRERTKTGFKFNIVNKGGNSTGYLRMDWLAIA